MPDIDIRYDDRYVQRRLNQLLKATGDLTPAMREIAQHLVDAAEGAREDQRDPVTHKAWAPLRASTMLDFRGGTPPAAPPKPPPAPPAASPDPTEPDHHPPADRADQSVR